jgi:hypothetical protein
MASERASQQEIVAAAQKTAEISLPVAITVFPDEIYRTPENMVKRITFHPMRYSSLRVQGWHFWTQIGHMKNGLISPRLSKLLMGF